MKGDAAAPRRPALSWRAASAGGWLRAPRGGLLVIVLAAGTGSGLGAAFRYLIYVLTWLEASDVHTRRLYLAHGYGEHGSPIRLPGGPLMYPMWRQPRIRLQGSK